MPEASKAVLRRQLRARRRDIDRRDERSAMAAVHLTKSVLWTGRIALFHAIGSEISTKRLLEAAWAQGLEVALPVVVGKDQPLSFRRTTSQTPLVEGAFGVMEPQSDDVLEDLDLVVVPSLGFDRQGGRLGYGGGYYDRTLAPLRAYRLLLAFADQELEAIPMGPHDARMDAVVTETGWIRLPERG